MEIIERDVTMSELAELRAMFYEQVEEEHILFRDEEQEEEALFDFIDQYIHGNDDPQVLVL